MISLELLGSIMLPFKSLRSKKSHDTWLLIFKYLLFFTITAYGTNPTGNNFSLLLISKEYKYSLDLLSNLSYKLVSRFLKSPKLIALIHPSFIKIKSELTYCKLFFSLSIMLKLIFC